MFRDEVLRIAAQGFAVALTTALLAVPCCIALARRFGIVDKPGGRKTHARVTPLMGGVGVVVGAAVGALVVALQSSKRLDTDLGFSDTRFLFVVGGSVVLFAIGLIDDVFKETMSFQPKLVGQVVGVLVLMAPQLARLWEQGGSVDQWLYQLFFLGWYLTIVNSFNFSDNMNGLMSGLSVIAFTAAILYLQNSDSIRSMMVAVLLVGALLGFMPFNFPRSRVFLGDAGSMFVGFWMAWIQFDLIKGFMGVGANDFGASHLIPAILIMGVPLFDAAYVVVMRVVDRRPIYLGDNHHLSHRLVRGGFTSVEAVVILWGLGLILAWVGILAVSAKDGYRYLIFAFSFLFMVAVCREVMALERAQGFPGSRYWKKPVGDDDDGSVDEIGPGGGGADARSLGGDEAGPGDEGRDDDVPRDAEVRAAR
ncbi:MAG: undecaprenyl/decaprenyl-phosphate alpha-N-acetylglucosaminyl 1-phosphate transferase [Planctomycetes bacterium]|nr:undecaprenyl/decaprenyl-phosphate alpha-N-acetylglucosaminyl 1-phosphate transferase [Planctomycetota bacterium]